MNTETRSGAKSETIAAYIGKTRGFGCKLMTSSRESGQIISHACIYVAPHCVGAVVVKQIYFGQSFPRFHGRVISGGRGCLEEGCLGLPDVFPDSFRTVTSLRNHGKDGKNLHSQTWPGSPSQTSATTRSSQPRDLGGMGYQGQLPMTTCEQACSTWPR